ncbi:hypothetical protein GCM10020366_02860 [Saccharopolyspora gregorii]|uniref:Uncharacterized protein n=1 Tax=Saccharopolyspora gregorii TaxID=33914 RepID=A0ABP6RK03_9PSEU
MGGVDRIREEFRTGPGGCFVGGAVGSVEADDGVEVDRSAPLVFGDLGVGQPGVVGEVPHPDSGRFREVAA